MSGSQNLQRGRDAAFLVGATFVERSAWRTTDVPHLAATEAGKRNVTRHFDRRFSGDSISLKAIEEERPVLNDRPTQSATKRVTNQRGTRNLFLADYRGTGFDLRIIGTKNAGGVVKEVIRSKLLGSIKLKQRSVKVVGAALRHQRHLRATRTALIRICIRGGYAKFFNCLGIETQHCAAVRDEIEGVRTVGRISIRVGGLIGLCLVDVYTVERDV